MSDPFAIPAKKLGILAPTPALVSFRNTGSAKFERSLGVIPPDEGWEIHTRLDQERLQGVANRNIVMPYFMRQAKEIHEMAKPGQPVRAMLVLGEPSTGKTYNLMATAKHYGDPMFFGCDGKRAEELFKQVRFSYSDGEPLETRVDKVIGEINGGARRMDALSLTALRQLGAAFHEEKGKYGIDWPQVAPKGEAAADGHAPDKAAYSGVFAAVEQFMQAQGVAFEHKQMDVKYVDGPIIEAIKQKRPFVILDEFTRMQDYDNLLGVMEVFMGLKDSHPLTDADGHAVPCKKGELPILLMTGNNLNDIGVTRMPDALRSRLKRMQIEMPESEAEKQLNWQHVIDTLISGLPLNTLVKATYGGNAPDARLQDADQLREFFVEYFSFALSEEEQRLQPKWKQSMQLNWESVTEASEHLAKFFVGLKDYFDPKAPMYSGEDNDPLQGWAARVGGQQAQQVQRPNNAQIDSEMNEKIKTALRRMREPVQIDFRSFAVAVMEAATRKEHAVAGDKHGPWFLQPKNLPAEKMKAPERAPIEQKFGGQLVSAIINWRDELLKNIDDPDARDGLRKLTDQHMANCRLINQKSKLDPTQDVAAGPKRVDELLTIDPEKYRTVSDEAKLLRQAIIEKIEKKYPAMAGDVPSDFISESTIEGLLRDITRNQNGPNHELLLLNPKMKAEDVSAPLARGISFDAAADDEVKKVVDIAKKHPTSLTDIETLLEGITLPAVGKKNFERLWSRDLSKAGIADTNDPALQVAENRAPSGLAVATLTCKNKNGDICPLQIWRNGKNNTTLIVGDNIDPELKVALESAKTGLGITYINRHAADAEKEARTVIAHILEGDDPKGKQRFAMIKAFTLRHKITSQEDGHMLSEKEIGHIGTARLAVNDGTSRYRLPEWDHTRSSPVTIETTTPNIIVVKTIQK